MKNDIEFVFSSVKSPDRKSHSIVPKFGLSSNVKCSIVLDVEDRSSSEASQTERISVRLILKIIRLFNFYIIFLGLSDTNRGPTLSGIVRLQG